MPANESQHVDCPVPAKERKVFEPGVYFDMGNETYHGSAGISKSGLMLFADNPEKYHWKYVLGNDPDTTKKHLDVGQAFHTATLEPEKFEKLFVVAPSLNKNSTAYKDWKASINGDMTILDVKDYDMAMGMAQKVRRHPIAKNLVVDGFAESSIFASDPITGELVKVRPDYKTGDVVVDLKSTTDASAGKFFRDMYTFKYFVQAGMYREVINWVAPGEINEFVFIAVEKDEPFSIGLYRASREDKAYGVDNFRRNLDMFADYKRRNYWPSYNLDMIVDTALPAWAQKSENWKDIQNR